MMGVTLIVEKEARKSTTSVRVAIAHLGKDSNNEVVGSLSLLSSSSSSNINNFEQNLSSLNWISLEGEDHRWQRAHHYVAHLESAHQYAAHLERRAHHWTLMEEGSSLGCISSSKEGRLEETSRIGEELNRTSRSISP
jgi:hypothetical protein